MRRKRENASSITLNLSKPGIYFVTYPIDNVSVHRRSSGSNGADDGSQSSHGYDEAGGNKASNDHHRGNERKGKERPIGKIAFRKDTSVFKRNV